MSREAEGGNTLSSIRRALTEQSSSPQNLTISTNTSATQNFSVPHPQSFQVPRTSMTLYFDSFGPILVGTYAKYLIVRASVLAADEASMRGASSPVNPDLLGRWSLDEGRHAYLGLQSLHWEPPGASNVFTWQDLGETIDGLEEFFPVKDDEHESRRWFSCKFRVSVQKGKNQQEIFVARGILRPRDGNGDTDEDGWSPAAAS